MIKKELIVKSEAYMRRLSSDDVAHDFRHIYRVLALAIEISRYEENVDMYILVLACLLHDIGRQKQRNDPAVCHAEAGAQMAYDFLTQEGLDRETALAVKNAIISHRYRSKHIPQSIEAKILFDADTLDVTGAIGIARTLQYEGYLSIPLYSLDINRKVIQEGECSQESFFQEYEFKLQNLYDRFYTLRAKEIACSRQKTAKQFYESLVYEINEASMDFDGFFEIFPSSIA